MKTASLFIRVDVDEKWMVVWNSYMFTGSAHGSFYMFPTLSAQQYYSSTRRPNPFLLTRPVSPSLIGGLLITPFPSPGIIHQAKFSNVSATQIPNSMYEPDTIQ